MKNLFDSKNGKRIAVCAGLSAVIAVTAAGCSGKDKGDESNANKVSYWMQLPSAVSQYASNMGDTEFGKALIEQTGVDIEWIHPAAGQATEKFNIMIASQNMPDIVEYGWAGFAGGPDKAIEDKVIVSLDDYKDKLPNYFKIMESDETINKLSQTDSGKHFAAYMTRFDRELDVSGGFIIRQDWLDDLGLEKPETVDEWENVLTQFKEKKGATSPLCINLMWVKSGTLTWPYKTTMSYYVDGSEVKFGPMQPEFKQFLEGANRWYEKGLINSDFATIEGSTVEAEMLNGSAGIMYGGLGGGIGKLNQLKANEQPYKVAGIRYPVLNKGERSMFSTAGKPLLIGSYGAAITTKAKNIDAACKVLDYGYSEAGHMLYNFGIEGESYEMVDGYPKYTENITNNAEGKDMSTMMSHYMRSYDGGPFVQDKRYMEQYAPTDVQQESWQLWSDTEGSKNMLPIVYTTTGESDEFAQLNTSIETYVDEMVVKFIMGKEPIENFDKFVAEIKNRGIDRALQIKQDAFNRYNNR